MKTQKLILALSLALILTCGFSNLQAQGNNKHDLNTSTVFNPIAVNGFNVCYTVRIENLNIIQQTGGQYLVMMTDGNGRQIAPAKPFRPGVQDYNFFESTGWNWYIRGTRVARLVQTSSDVNSNLILSTSRTGIFSPSACYLFVIRPVLIERRHAGIDVH